MSKITISLGSAHGESSNQEVISLSSLYDDNACRCSFSSGEGNVHNLTLFKCNALLCKQRIYIMSVWEYCFDVELRVQGLLSLSWSLNKECSVVVGQPRRKAYYGPKTKTVSLLGSLFSLGFSHAEWVRLFLEKIISTSLVSTRFRGRPASSHMGNTVVQICLILFNWLVNTFLYY